MTLTTIGDENETLFDSIYSKFQKYRFLPEILYPPVPRFIGVTTMKPWNVAVRSMPPPPAIGLVP